MITATAMHKTTAKALAPLFKAKLEGVLAEVAFDGQAHAVRTLIAHGKVHTGHLSGNIHVDLTRIPLGESRVWTAVPYSGVVEFGAGPSGENPTPGWWPPDEPIREWARRKLKLTGKELDSAVWGIRAAINERGIVPTPFMRPAAEHMRVRFNQLAVKAIGSAFKGAGSKVQTSTKEAH